MYAKYKTFPFFFLPFFFPFLSKIMGSRGAYVDGTDGSDFSKREVVAEHYQRIGHAKAAIKPWLKVQQGLYVRKTPQRSAHGARCQPGATK